MEKKKYIAPETEFVDLKHGLSIMLNDSPFKDPGNGGDDGRGNYGDQSNETVGGAWENIWNQQ